MDMILLAQTVSLALPALWLALGMRDNILHPSVNETFTAQVMTLERMKTDFPEQYARLAHRAVPQRSHQRTAFRLAILGEGLALILLWTGVVLMGLALFGSVPVSGARSVAILGALTFTSVWAGFLIVGEHFAYWFCHDGAQNTHFQMVLWGLGNMIFLSL